NIQLAMELFYDRYNNYPYTAGWIECSGYNYTNATYHTGQDLESTIETEGLMSQVPFDPSGSPADCGGGQYADGGYRSYMQYLMAGATNYCLYANLENPSAGDQATYTAAPYQPGYGMDYAICN
ncbi:MAG: hypothetical protein Q8N68_03320, partial [bacterium]|nr:hypothetical protein [bacterium]